MNTLYTLWFLAIASYAIPMALCAGKYLLSFVRSHDRASLFLGMFFSAIFIEGVNAAASLLIWWPNETTTSGAYALDRVVGRSVLSIGAWLITFYLFRIVNGEGSPLQAPRSGDLEPSVWIAHFDEIRERLTAIEEKLPHEAERVLE